MLTGDQLKEKLRGPVVAMTTHFKEDYSVDLDAMKRLTEFYVEQKIATVIVTGSTGEFFSLTDDERRQVQKTVIAKPNTMLDLIESCNGHAGGFKDSTGNFSFYRAHSQLLEGRVATMGSAGMNYYLWGHEFGSSCFLTGLGNIWPRWEIEFYDHLAAGWYCTY